MSQAKKLARHKAALKAHRRRKVKKTVTVILMTAILHQAPHYTREVAEHAGVMTAAHYVGRFLLER